MSTELWKIEWQSAATGGRVGAFNREFVEGDEAAEDMLIELLCAAEANTSRRGLNGPWRRCAAWIRKQPDVDQAELEYVDHVKAYRLVDGEWERQELLLEPPTLHWRRDPKVNS